MPTAVTQAFITAGTALSNGTDYVLAENVTMTTPFSFSGSGAGVTFDGSGHTVTAPNGWPGLFSKAVSVSNLGVLSSGSTRNDLGAGWFFQSGVGGNATNCYSTGAIVGGGGIFGTISSGTATNCYSTGEITDYGGGIFGPSTENSATATNCYSTGVIGTAGGGIFGINSTSSATNCYSTGAIGNYGGGIFGANSIGTATNCYSTGVIGANAGPIFGDNTTGTLTNCYSTGGGLWSDTAADAQLTGFSTVWLRYNNVVDTPYLLVANPQPPSNNTNLLTVVVNGSTRVVSNGSYAYTFDSRASIIPVLIRSQDPHAIVSLQDLSGGGDVSGNLTGLVSGPNSFTIQVVSDSGVATATYPLTITRPLPTPINQAFVDASTALVNETDYVVVADLSMTTPFSFSGSGADITIDGSGHTVTAPDGWPGLFSKAVSVSNLGILSSGQTSMYAGWFFQDGIGGTATNCYSTGTINAYGGGIFGQGATGTAINCHSTGEILNAGGGIFGYSTTSCSATNCYSTGAISYAGGGIFGNYATSGSATNCDSTGTIGQHGGGIYGPSVNCTALYCYSTGSIDIKGGGIFGYTATSCTATACYSTGDIASQAGGIVGYDSFGSVTNCYSTGTVDTSANAIGGGNVSVTNCYSTNGGQWSDASANAANALTGFSTVWFSYNNAANTSYLLVSNPQPPNSNSSNNSLSSVVVNGVTLTGPAPYSYTMPSNAASASVSIVTSESHATVSIIGTDLSGVHDLQGSLTLVDGSNSFTLQVVAQDGSTTATYALAITNPLPLINQAFVDAGTALMKGKTYRLVADLSMSTPFSFSQGGLGTITIEGSGHTITVPDQWPGLFSQAVTVSNLGVLSSGSTQEYAGWFFANSVGGTATNCYSTGAIGYYGGGIFGQRSSGTATHCYSTGTIGDVGGGIFGIFSSGTATNCYSTGAMVGYYGRGYYGGGIFGGCSNGSATNCYSTGIIGIGGGGIFGVYSAGSATKCYSTGDICESGGGGIFGQSSEGPATNCYSTGDIGVYGGGIFGYSSQGPATNCYSTGRISQYSGGIYGVGSLYTTATNCYSTGSIGVGGGGISAPYSQVTINRCYVTNGGLWSDAAANAQLTRVPGQSSPVWLRYNNVVDTPYLLVANPQPPSNNINLLTIVVNGSTRVASNGAYDYTFDSSASTIPISIVTEQPHAIVSVGDLSGGGDVSGSLPLVPGSNLFTVSITAQNGITTASYPLTINAPSNNDDLSSVSVNGVTVDISGGVYSVSLPSNAASVPVRIITDNSNSRVQVADLSGTYDISGSLSLPNTGFNPFSISVVAPNGANSMYLLTIENPSATGFINQAFVDASTALVDGTTYTVTEDLTMTTPFSFARFGIGITVEGSGHTITVPDQWPGLFSRPVTVSNLGILSSGSTQDYAGWFFQSHGVGTATNCYSTGTIGTSGGGIFGNQASGSATNCYSTGAIGNGAGGIFGAYSQSPEATNCYSTGDIGENGGGIFGNTSPGSATNCYSTGTIGTNAGGIFQSVTDDVNITHCYFTSGDKWSDTSANTQLIGVSGEAPPTVWFSYNNVANTPYFLVANPQPPSSNNSLSSVVVNGVTLTGPAPYSYTMPSNAASATLYVVTEATHAIVRILGTDLSGAHDLSGSLTLSDVSNSFTIQVVASDGTPATYSLAITNPLPPQPPTSLGGIRGNGSVSLSWTAPATGPTPTSYKVYRSTDSGTTYPSYNTVLSTSLDVSGLTNGTTYTFKVQSVYGGVSSSDSNVISRVPATYPGAPSSVTATSGANASSVVSWTAPTSNGGDTITGYTVTSSPGSITATTNGATSVTVTGLMNGTSYMFTVTATNSQGTGSSASTSVSATPSLLAPPTLSVSDLGNGSLMFSRGTSSGATSYTVYISTSVSAGFTVATTNLSVAYTPPRISGAYYFKISASNSGGEGSLSAPTSPITIRNVPVAPTNVVATSNAANSVSLTWTAPTDTGNSAITSYRVFNNNNPRQSIATTNAATRSVTVATTSNGVANKFFVVAVNAIGNSANSALSNSIITTLYASTVNQYVSSGSTTTFIAAITTASTPDTAILNARAAIQNANAAGLLTPTQRQALTVAALQSLNVTGSTLSVVNTSSTASLLATMANVNTTGLINTALPTGYVIPVYSTGASPHTATINLQSTLVVNGNTVSYATMISQQLGYLVFELPNSVAGSVYQLTLTNGASSLTLTYDGTVLNDTNSNEYTANSVLQIGNLSIPLLGLGSIGTNTTSLSLVTVNSSEPLQTPYAYTISSNSTTASVVIQATNPQTTVIVRNSSGVAVLEGTAPTPGNVSGSLTSLVTGPNTFTINVTSQDGTSTTNYSLTITNPAPGPVPCFPAGTRILTPTGYKAVETLTQNELVLTADGRQVPVKIYGKYLEVTTSVTAPYRVPKGSFGLANDLVLSPDHAFQIRKGLWMLPKRAALLSDRVEQVDIGSPVTYYHLECPQYLRDNLVVDGTVVESYGGKTKSPYTYSERLKGYTRSGPIKNITKA